MDGQGAASCYGRETKDREGGFGGLVVCGKSGLLRCVADIVEQVQCRRGEVRAQGDKEGRCWVLLLTDLVASHKEKQRKWLALLDLCWDMLTLAGNDRLVDKRIKKGL